jgi:hypothetical protein
MNDPKDSALIVFARYFLFIYIYTFNIHFFLNFKDLGGFFFFLHYVSLFNEGITAFS